MKFNRLRLLWQDTLSKDTDSQTDSGEARFRAIVLTILMLVGPPLLLYLYRKVMFVGLVNPDAQDLAQIGRNLSNGRGFVTDILRPLALTHGSNPLRQPDVTHGPLYPFLLSLAFGAFGCYDGVAADVSSIFYVLTIPVVYILGVRLFNRSTGFYTALIFTFNALALEYAASGLNLTLNVFLTTCLMLVFHQLAVDEQKGIKAELDAGEERIDKRGHIVLSAPRKLPKGILIWAAVITALLYLTDPIFIWIVPVTLIAVGIICQGRSLEAVLRTAVPLAVFLAPWMIRNGILTGDPVFGLRGMELWMNTRSHYPELSAYRLTPSNLIPSVGLFQDIVNKVLLSAGTVIQSFPQVTASWLLAFFLPCLLFQFNSKPANQVRGVLIWTFVALLIGSLLFSVQMPLFVSLIPAMLLFSVAYLTHLFQQADLLPSQMRLATVLLAVVVVYPLLSDMMLEQKTPPVKEAGLAHNLDEIMAPDEIALSDQPWIVAWYADRPSMWLPENDKDLVTLRQDFPGTHWLFLTDQIIGYSDEWQYVYDGFAEWNLATSQAHNANQPSPPSPHIKANGTPLFQSLAGFYGIEQPGKVMTTCVIATDYTNKAKLGAVPSPMTQPTQ